jgi:hypothetical protein
MYKKIRKSVADVIANVNDPEQFKWNKWLREPQVFSENLIQPHVTVQNINSYSTFSIPALFQVKNFALTKIKVSSAIKNISIPKKKSFKVFFSFAKSYQRQIKILESDSAVIKFSLSYFYKEKQLFLKTLKDSKETIFKLGTQCFSKTIDDFKVSIKSESIEFKETECLQHDFNFKDMKISVFEIKMPSKLTSNEISKIYLTSSIQSKISSIENIKKLVKAPKIKNIQILSVEEVKKQLDESETKKVLSFPIIPLPEKPKNFNVKFPAVEKIRVSLYQIKNLQIKEPKLKLDRLILLRESEILKKKQYVKRDIKPEIHDPGILNLLKLKEKDDTKEKMIHEEKPIENKKAEENISDIKNNKNENYSRALLKHQNEDYSFLLENEKFLLSDELGISAKTQVVCGLISGLRNGTIRNALIVCSNPNIGNRKVAEKIAYSEGWANQISYWGSEISFSTIALDADQNPPEIKENSQVYIIDYATLLNATGDLEANPIFSSIDCLILDDAQILISEKAKPEQLFKFPKSKYLWIISSYPSRILEDKLIPILKNHLPGFEQLDRVLNRKKQDLSEYLPEVTRQDYWLELDKDQKQEFENTITQGRKRISNLISSGNPFIIQSNIFTLIHQIKQIGNFSTHNDNSPKAELLLEHLESILSNGEKTIVFSQYDKQGIQKIERLLKGNNIRYVLFQSGMPLKTLENSVKTFKQDSKIHVMIAGLTAATMKMKLAEAPYFIHFDQWWNPINQWQYEDKTLTNGNSNQLNNKLCVLNYFTNNPFEINLRETLQKKGLLNKNLVDFLSNEIIYSLVSNDDWLDVLGIEHSKTKKSTKLDVGKLFDELSGMKSDLLGQRVKAFYTKVGFKHLMLKPDTQHNLSSIFGHISKGDNDIKTATLCLPFDSTNADAVETFIKESLKNYTRVFVICSKEISKNIGSERNEKISWIDQEMLAQYLSLFKVI